MINQSEQNRHYEGKEKKRDKKTGENDKAEISKNV